MAPKIGILVGETDEGAIPDGSRIVKTLYEEGDATKLGEKGTILSSLRFPEDIDLPEEITYRPKYIYVVVWDHSPNLPTHIQDKKIALESSN